VRRSWVLVVGAVLAIMGLFVAGCAGPGGERASAYAAVSAGRPPLPPPGIFDDLMRAFRGAAQEAPPGLPLPRSLPTGGLPRDIAVGYQTMRSLRQGNDYEKAAARLACHAMNTYGPASSHNPRQQEWEQRIYSYMYLEFRPGGAYNYLVRMPVSRAAGAVATAQTAPAGWAQYYLQYCFR
jgi:hypothetical protein